jgi:ankyrin repeat protein
MKSENKKIKPEVMPMLYLPTKDTTNAVISIAVLKRLLAAGANVNSPGGNNGGRSALAIAAIFGHVEALDLLLSHGAK